MPVFFFVSMTGQVNAGEQGVDNLLKPCNRVMIPNWATLSCKS